jgi:hypothetical protein
MTQTTPITYSAVADFSTISNNHADAWSYLYKVD